ncbi:MAG TPA: phosphotransferase family protein [Ilumatobacter sp.]|nr:phosphotransferase family protein [Ilumatobacter sp.]
MEGSATEGLPAGIEAGALGRWLTDHVEHVTAPVRFALIAGGNSNLTYAATDANGRRLVVRRPPLRGVLSTAHDMEREWRAIRALGDTAVPVPPALAFCDDTSVIGSDFYVTEFVAGHVLHDLAGAVAATTPSSRARTSESIVDVLCELHAIDPDDVGLGEHGRRDGNYLERQLGRWSRQYAQTKTDEIPDVERAHTLLTARVPPVGETRVVHGDYRLGNCILAESGAVAAVVDWEISTLGDPLADVAYLLTTWARPAGPVGRLHGAELSPSMAEGFAEPEQLLARYAERSGRDVGGIAFHLAFNHWRYACIAQGVRSRQLDGAQGDAPTADLKAMAIAVRERAALALRTLAAGT